MVVNALHHEKLKFCENISDLSSIYNQKSKTIQ